MDWAFQRRQTGNETALKRPIGFLYLGIGLLGCGGPGDPSNKTESPKAIESPAEAAYRDHLEKGRMLSQRAAETLNARLNASLQQGGTEGAVAFCSLKGLPLLDSLEEAHGVHFRRAAVRYRNPENRANAQEAEHIARYEAELAEGRALEPVVVETTGGKTLFFSPIVLAPNCTQCHGKEIEPAVMAQIKARYPEDRATGFDPGQIRGLWSLEL